MLFQCRACDGYDTRLTRTVFANTRQRPATLVLLLRGVAKGEPTARLACAWGRSRKPLHTMRQRIQTNLNETAPTGVMTGTVFEADELYQKAGEKGTPHPDSADPPRRCANKRQGHGTYANDRPLILSIVSRDPGEHRFWVCDHAAQRTCDALLAENSPVRGTMLDTDAWQGDHDSHATHAMVGQLLSPKGSQIIVLRRQHVVDGGVRLGSTHQGEER